MNPEFRQRLNTISRNLESANEAAQENIYTFAQLYIDPCLSGLKLCLHDCTAPCFPNRDNQMRRKRGRSRGRAELNFDFYDDWDNDLDSGNNLLGWGNDELDSLLAGNRNAPNGQPPKQRAMNYGSRGRKGGMLPANPEQDPTVIPSSSYLGFLERLPWKFGSRAVRYTPSAADLQENPGGTRVRDMESEPLIEEEDDDEGNKRNKKPRHGRQRSSTAASQSTTNSLSSRGDLIMSDEEDDAVPLDDEFAVMLSRRITNTGSEDQSSAQTGSSRPRVSQASTRTVSSKSTRSAQTKSRTPSVKKSTTEIPVSPSVAGPPGIPATTTAMVDLKREEDQIRKEEEMEVAQKREPAQRLALSRGLDMDSTVPEATGVEIKPEDDEGPIHDDESIITTLALPMREASPEPLDETTPFPPLPPSTDRDEDQAPCIDPP